MAVADGLSNLLKVNKYPLSYKFVVQFKVDVYMLQSQHRNSLELYGM